MTNDHPPPDTPKILEVLEPFVDFCECQMRFGANDFAHRHDPPRGHGLHDNLVRRDYKISVFKKRIGMSPLEVEQVLAIYQDGTANSLRNRAMLLLLARLGLRAHEVVSLCLDDIDWVHGHLDIRPGKTRQARR